MKTYQDDWELSVVVEVSEIFAADCPAIFACHFAAYSAAQLHHMFHHQSLTDCQRSEKIRSTAAAATNQLSWWSAVMHRCNKVQIVERETNVGVARGRADSWGLAPTMKNKKYSQPFQMCNWDKYIHEVKCLEGPNCECDCNQMCWKNVKNIKFVAIRCVLSSSKCTKTRFRPGLHPDF